MLSDTQQIQRKAWCSWPATWQLTSHVIRWFEDLCQYLSYSHPSCNFATSVLTFTHLTLSILMPHNAVYWLQSWPTHGMWLICYSLYSLSFNMSMLCASCSCWIAVCYMMCTQVNRSRTAITMTELMWEILSLSISIFPLFLFIILLWGMFVWENGYLAWS